MAKGQSAGGRLGRLAGRGAAGGAEGRRVDTDVSLTEGRRRVVIEGVEPLIDGGRFPIKRVIDDLVTVEADVFADGHDQVECRLLFRREADGVWAEVPMRALGNDRWRGEFPVSEIGRYRYTIEGWTSRFRTWRADLVKRLEAGQDVGVELLIGAQLIEDAAGRAPASEGEYLRAWAQRLRTPNETAAGGALALDEKLGELAQVYADRGLATRYGLEPAVIVDRVRARYSTWYEVFPRSCAPEPGRHGTFRDCEAWLPYIAGMGFDVLYLPPIHPIGRSFRKGRDNTVTAQPEDVGSPWAIGAVDGGHTAVHPDLGTLADFRRLVARAREAGLEVALDIAFQCSPDHPWVRDHPEWFRSRPDGTIQYAENPPKKYQDIYPLDFETPAWRELWNELRDVMLFWAEQGVRILRVDNPHTKAFPFWEWALAEVKARYPDVLFLSEAFTRPRVMYRLAKLGFSQSYTYFTWRNTKAELTDYFTELTRGTVREYFRPNLWPNTPDILPEFLQVGGRPAFAIRLVLAATLGANYGIYGPAYELGENNPHRPGSEEYLNSEKYELKHWNLNALESLRDLIGRVNRARRENPALQRDDTLRFHEIDNPMLLCYSKTSDDPANLVVVVVSLDPFHAQRGWLRLDLEALGLPADQAFEVHDLLGDRRYLWEGQRNYVEVAPPIPARLFLAHRRMRTERDFDYFT
jgi:starch synthase (maltosyl-transferring)